MRTARSTYLIGVAAVVALTAGVYLRAGTAGAYLAADDYQWLTGGLRMDWWHLFTPATRQHFYRPAIDAWFMASTTACGPATACYHLLNLSVHLINVGLLMALIMTLTSSAGVTLLAGALWGVQPTPSQAVVWVSAITGLLATCFYLVSLVAQARSWSAATARRRTALEVLAGVAFLFALLAHEAAATLPLVSLLMWRWFAPASLLSRRVLIAALAIPLAVFAATTIAANRQNYVFTEDHYRVGAHMIRHALDFLVSLFVMPRWWVAYAAASAIVVALLFVSASARFGVCWLLVTMVPYLGFTTDNVSRYFYLPSIGFSLAIATLIDRVWRWAQTAWPRQRTAVNATALLIALFAVVRSAVFCSTNVAREVGRLEPWREAARRVEASVTRAPDGVAIESSGKEEFEPYLASMIQWIEQDPRLPVTIRPR